MKDWRKKVYAILEKHEDGGDEILKAMKADLTGEDGFDGMEAKIRLKDKTIGEHETKITELEGKLKEAGSAVEEKTGLEGQIQSLTNTVNELTGTVKTITQERDDERLNTEKATKEKNQLAVKTKLMEKLPGVFGNLTGKLLSEKYSESETIKLSEDGKTLTMNDGGVDYTGDEVIERVKTLNKDDITGKEGPGTTKKPESQTPASTVENHEKSSHELFTMALNDGAQG